jgi:hypothetical protein
MTIISCSVPTIAIGANCPSTHKNRDINIDNINTINTCDNVAFIGHIIQFYMTDNSIVEWAYNSKRQRDVDYNRIKNLNTLSS